MVKIIEKVKSLVSRNEPMSVATHFFGFWASIVALGFMIFYAKTYGSVKHVIGFSVFGVSMILLYAASSLYHSFPRLTKIKEIFQRIDHSMIFVLIAGSYTPICLLMDNQVCGKSLLITVWVIAIAGIILKLTGVKMKEWVSVLIYVILGSFLLLAIGPISSWLPKNALGILYGCGSLYIVGLIFFGLDNIVPRKFFGMHEIWHLFVLAANFSHVGLMIDYVLYI